METQNALVIGIGYVGIRLVEKINSLGIKVFGLSRNEKSLEKLERYDAHKIYWDEKSLLNFSLVDNKINFVLSTVPPNSIGNDPVLNIFNKKLSQYKGWLGYISSTSVYGGENNQIIDEIQNVHHKLVGELQGLKLRKHGLTLVQKFLELLEYMVIKDHLLRNYQIKKLI